MINAKKIASATLSSLLSFGLSIPALAAINESAVIDYDKTATLNIHKIIDNDGNTEVSYGLARPNESRVPVNNVGFDYTKIAEIENVAGIIISDQDGNIDYDADDRQTQIGAFYVPNEKFVDFANDNGVFPAPTYIKTSTNNENNSLQYEIADHNANNLLISQSENVQNKRDALNRAIDEKREADNTFAAKSAAYETAQQKEQQALNAKNAATELQRLAVEKNNNAITSKQNADQALSQATASLRQANTQLENATSALESAQTNNKTVLSALNAAQSELKRTKKALQFAQNELTDAQSELTKSKKDQANATQALESANSVLARAQNDHNAAKTGTPYSETGVANALASASQQVQSAINYKAQADNAVQTATEKVSSAQAKVNQATIDLKTADTNLSNAISNTASGSNSTYNTLKEKMSNYKDAVQAVENANNAVNVASALSQKANSEATVAATALRKANTALDEAVTAYNSATQASGVAQDEKELAENQQSSKQRGYESAQRAYNDAVEELDSIAEENGIAKIYTAQAMQDALKDLITTLSEETISNWVKEHTDYNQIANGKYTDDHGLVTFSGLPLGLYMVAETDISYHDGYAGAWNDEARGFINNDQMNTYDENGYHIIPVDAHGRKLETKTYQKGDLYRESVNPEAPVLESPAAPFLVSLPTTNPTNTSDQVAAGDNSGESAGTVWQYTVDVYPKNQSTAIYKRIIDPDEEFGTETLRTSEDYQIGDEIQEIIWADAPKLQKNYLDLSNPNSVNRHVSYAITNTVTEGITVDSIKEVFIMSKQDLIKATDRDADNTDGVNRERTVFVNAEGSYVNLEDAVEVTQIKRNSYVYENGVMIQDKDGNMSGTHYVPKTKVKYYDDKGREISAETFSLRTGKSINNIQYKVDINNDGKDVGAGTTYNAASGMTGTYWAERVSCKFMTIPSTASNVPFSITAFSPSQTGDETIDKKVLNTDDYIYIDTDVSSATITDGRGKTETIVEAGTHGFVVKLTESGLEKLNQRTKDSVVVVVFNATLNEKAKIGQVPENSNYPSLYWANTNSSIKGISGNNVYAYTYELRLKKEFDEPGIDASQVKFVVSRDDTGDFNQEDASTNSLVENTSYDILINKNMTDVVAKARYYGQDDSMKFVKEAEGVYHLYNNDGPVESASLKINGIEQLFNYVSPDSNGNLIIKGIDSDSYIFKEIETAAGKNLLADIFTVKITAPDCTEQLPLDSLRDGTIATATVTTQNPKDASDVSAPVDITVGIPGIDNQDSIGDANNLGIAGLSISNNSIIDLRTGGKGRMLIYICGVALLGAVTIGVYNNKRKELQE